MSGPRASVGFLVGSFVTLTVNFKVYTHMPGLLMSSVKLGDERTQAIAALQAKQKGGPAKRLQFNWFRGQLRLAVRWRPSSAALQPTSPGRAHRKARNGGLLLPIRVPRLCALQWPCSPPTTIVTMSGFLFSPRSHGSALSLRCL